MRQFLPLFIIFIIWRVISSTRQAKREKDELAKRTLSRPEIDRAIQAIRTPELSSHERSIEPRMSYETEREEYTDTSDSNTPVSNITDSWDTISSQTTDFLSDADAARAREESERDRPSYEKPRTQKKSATVTRSSSATEASAAASDRLAATAYDTEKVGVRRRISLDDESLKTFFITREVLGPPRARQRRTPFKR